MAARKQKQRRMSAQVVEDEDYQLRYEIVAGIDVAKDSAVVCVRMPPVAGRKHRFVRETGEVRLLGELLEGSVSASRCTAAARPSCPAEAGAPGRAGRHRRDSFAAARSPR